MWLRLSVASKEGYHGERWAKAVADRHLECVNIGACTTPRGRMSRIQGDDKMSDAETTTNLVRRQESVLAVAGLAAVILMGLMSTGCNADRTEAVRAYNEGLEAFESGSSSKAVQRMEAALEQDPTFTVAAYTAGQIQQQRLGDPDGAVQNFRRALDHDPDNPRYAYRLGSALADLGEHEEAIGHFEKAVAEDPDYSRAWFEQGMSQETVGDFVEAVESFTKSIETNPRLRMDEDDPGGEAYHALADLYLRFRLYDHAVQVYENGVSNNPSSERLHHGQGVALMRLDRHGDAVDAFESALEIDPEHGSANFNIAVAQHESGDRDAAMEQLEQLIEQGGAGMTEPRRQAAQALLDDLSQEE